MDTTLSWADIGTTTQRRQLTHPALLPWRKLAVGSTCLAVALLPLLRPAGPGNSSPVDGAIAISILSTLGWAVSERLIVRVPYVVPIAIIGLAGLIASLFSLYPGTGLLAVVQDFVLLAWSTTVVTVCRTAGGLSAVLRVWAYAGVVWATLMIAGSLANIEALSGVTARLGTRASITFGDPNMAAGYFCTTLVLVWASATPRRRLARWGVAAILITAIVFTGSNGFSLATIAACTVAALVGVARRHGMLRAIVVACGLAAVAGLAATQLNVNSVVNSAASSAPVLRDYVGRFAQTTTGRASLLQETLGLVNQGGLIGIGPGAVKPTLQANQDSVAFEAHSDFTASLAERGLLGGMGLLSLIIAIGFYARRSLGRLRSDYADVVRHPGAFVAVTVALLIAANIYELLHFRYVWTYLAVLAAVGIAGRERFA